MTETKLVHFDQFKLWRCVNAVNGREAVRIARLRLMIPLTCRTKQ